MTLIGLLVAVVIICLVAWALRTLMAAFGVPQQIVAVVWVVFVLIVAIWLLSAVTGLGLTAGPVLRVH